jgi:hypothetical protein
MSSAGTAHPNHCCEHAHYVTKGCLDHFISGPHTKKITTKTRRQNTVKLVSWPCVLRSNAITVQYNTHRDYKDNKTHERMEVSLRQAKHPYLLCCSVGTVCCFSSVITHIFSIFAFYINPTVKSNFLVHEYRKIKNQGLSDEVI